jgi:hypothetical protein
LVLILVASWSAFLTSTIIAWMVADEWDED